MKEGMTVHLPVPIGKYVWLITNKGFVFRNKVVRYTINSDNPHDNRIHTAYKLDNGEVLTRYRAVSEFGQTIFLTEQAAIKAAREMLGV